MMGVSESSSSKKAYEMAKSLGLVLTSGKRNPGDYGVPVEYDFHGVGRAYDFAGSQDAMNKFAAWAKSSGLFAEVLWQVKGHYDHVHVAWGNTLYKGHEHETAIGNRQYIPRKETDVVEGAPSTGASSSSSSGSDLTGIIPNVTRFTIIIVAVVLIFILLVSAFPAIKIS